MARAFIGFGNKEKYDETLWCGPCGIELKAEKELETQFAPLYMIAYTTINCEKCGKELMRKGFAIV